MSNSSRTFAAPPAPAGSPLHCSDLQVVIPPAHEPVGAPIARMIPRVQVLHGEARVDHYHWLRDRSDPEVMAYLQAENLHTSVVMRHTEILQERLYLEMRSRIKEADLSVPERLDDYWYYTRTEAGAQYPIFCRKHGSCDGLEETLLDQNPLATGHEYFRVGSVQVSPNHQLLAY